MSWQLRTPCERAEVEALGAELGVSDVLAAVLVRRGYADPADARAFLEAGLPEHDPFLLGDMSEACEAIRAAVARSGLASHEYAEPHMYFGGVGAAAVSPSGDLQAAGDARREAATGVSP